MFQIAVCDDDAAEYRRLSGYVADFFSLRNMPTEIDTFQSGMQFLAAKKCYDLYFFDVMMPQMSGLETARALQKREDDPVIIFVTSSLESAVEGYSVRAAGFVLKPIQLPAFEETMNRVLKSALSAARLPFRSSAIAFRWNCGWRRWLTLKAACIRFM